MSNGLKTALRGLVIVAIGVVVTVVSYNLAAKGGTIYISTGLFVVGGWYVISGLFKHFTSKA